MNFLFLICGRVIMLILGGKILFFVYTVLLHSMTLYFIILVLLINQLLRSAKLDTEYREVMGQLEEFMNRKKLPLATRTRLRTFYEYKFQGKFVKEKKIENILSGEWFLNDFDNKKWKYIFLSKSTDRLKKEIYYHCSNKLIRQVQIFEDIPTKILSEITSHLKLEVFLPNDIIISAGAPAECMYFISSGTVCITTASGREVSWRWIETTLK